VSRFALRLGRCRGAKAGAADVADDNPDDDFLEIVEQLVAGDDLRFGKDNEERSEQERLRAAKKETAMTRKVREGHSSVGVGGGGGGGGDGSEGGDTIHNDMAQDVKDHYMYHTGTQLEKAERGGESKGGGTPVSGATISCLPRFYRAAGSQLTHLILSDSFRGASDDQMALLTTCLATMMTVTTLELERCQVGASGSPAGCACLMVWLGSHQSVGRDISNPAPHRTKRRGDEMKL
jgi:hypothetical protein